MGWYDERNGAEVVAEELQHMSDDERQDHLLQVYRPLYESHTANVATDR